MGTTAQSLLGTGIYTISEASHLTRVSPGRIRRWLKGYEFQSRHGRRRSPAVWHGQLEPIDHSLALGFLDLLEVRCVDAFLREGVSWKTLRLAHGRSQQRLKLSHPFSTDKFKAFGRDIILELPEQNDQPTLWDIARDQRVFSRIVQPFLKDLEFADGDLPQRWWPRGKGHLVALDPRRRFGQPIIFPEGIPTLVLARSVRANPSISEVARWFEVSPVSVREAVDFERSLEA